uniref:Uncharacterized protein n=1 Tax=Rhizophora mucronata TaxID=61149 RepID=A0A2P2R507_RHIMU
MLRELLYLLSFYSISCGCWLFEKIFRSNIKDMYGLFSFINLQILFTPLTSA